MPGCVLPQCRFAGPRGICGSVALERPGAYLSRPRGLLRSMCIQPSMDEHAVRRIIESVDLNNDGRDLHKHFLLARDTHRIHCCAHACLSTPAAMLLLPGLPWLWCMLTIICAGLVDYAEFVNNINDVIVTANSCSRCIGYYTHFTTTPTRLDPTHANNLIAIRAVIGRPLRKR